MAARNLRCKGPGGVVSNYIIGWEFQMGTMMSVKMFRLDQEQQHVNYQLFPCLYFSDTKTENVILQVLCLFLSIQF